MADGGITDEELAGLVRRSADGNAAFVRGDMDGFLALVAHADDYTLMAPFGGPPVRGFDASPGRLAELAGFFRCGTFEQGLVQTYVSGDLAVLVTIERQRGEVGGMPEQDWSLRVTQAFRREGAGWRLAHRHADPLPENIGLERAAALAGGGG